MKAIYLILAIGISSIGFTYQGFAQSSPVKYDYRMNYEGYSIVYNNVRDPFGDDDKRYGVLNAAGKQVTALMYDRIWPFSKDGFAIVQLKKKFGFINRNGVEIIPMQYEDAKDFKEGLAAVKQDGKYAFINTAGTLVTAFEYEDAGSFSEGLASVKKNGSWGYINKEGTNVIPYKYKYASYLSDGLAYVSENGLVGYINNKGELVVPQRLSYGYVFRDGVAVVSNE